MKSRQISVGDQAWNVRLDGPQSRHVVLLLPDAGDPADVYDHVCARLHTSDLRTVAVESVADLTPAALLAILDELGLPWVNIAGCGAGADLAWRVCATGFGRFNSLVVADRGHPAAPGPDGVVADADCRPVELSATILATGALPRTVADASARYVYGEFRVVEVDLSAKATVATDAANELATEIVLRTSLW